jgi:hypothetical protein
MAADNMADEDIAQTLFVTPKDRRGAPLERLPETTDFLADAAADVLGAGTQKPPISSA